MQTNLHQVICYILASWWVFITSQRQRVGVFAAGTRSYTELSQRPGIHHGVP